MTRIRVNGDRSDIRCEMVDGLATTERMYEITGERIQVSDGYHTMDELYAHRIELFIALCRYMHDRHGCVWRARMHSDGKGLPGWYIMGIYKGAGDQMTYHLPDDTWERTAFAETLDRGPEWDGHTSADVLKRLRDL